MKTHPLLNDPAVVVVYSTPVADPPTQVDFWRAGREVLEALEINLDGEKVVLKPNATSGERFADADMGINTHPAFVGGMLEYLGEHGARRGGLYIVEDPRNSDDFNPRHWQGTGYPEIAAASGAKLRSPVSYYCTVQKVPNPLVHAVRNVTRYAVDPGSVLINVPKLKTHNLAITSLCLKNLMGLDDVFDRHYCTQAFKELPVRQNLPRPEWMDESVHELWQQGLSRRLVDLAQVLHPRLNVIEGVVGRDGTGFQRGHNYTLGLAIAGLNMVAVDSVASTIMGFDPEKLVYLQAAAAAGLGCNKLAQLRVYTNSGGKLVICHDLEGLRVHPPFQVIRNIVGEGANDASAE